MRDGSVAEDARERVTLLSSDGAAIGSDSKVAAHNEATPLHLAFSLFLFDGLGRTLVQRRAESKRTWGGVWSNACCGHPSPGESLTVAVRRRAEYELGLTGIRPILALPDFRYRACWNGIWENEVCPVFVAVCSNAPSPNPAEVREVAWVEWADFCRASAHPHNTPFANFTPWSLLEVAQLKDHPILDKVLKLARRNRQPQPEGDHA